MSRDRIILGIDPGTQVFGWGVIKVTAGRAEYLAMGVSSLKGLPDHFAKLSRIFCEVKLLIGRFSPDQMAVEAPFYGKNIQSMLKLGRAQGAAIAAALSCGMDVYEYAPRKIKLSITGKGAASKEQVANVISKILNVSDVSASYDATDGLAVALCHFLSDSVPQELRSIKRAGSSGQGKSSGGWSSFVKSNPDRIK